MKKVLGILSMLSAISGCSKPLAKAEVGPIYPNDPKIYSVPMGEIKGRIYLIHGFGGDKSVYDNEPFISWINDLTDHGYEIVTFSLPKPELKWFSSDGGLQWKTAYLEYLRCLKYQIDHSKGTVPKNIIGGISFGGLHSLVAMEETRMFDMYFASLPVTDFTALDELRAGDSRKFEPFLNAGKLSNKKGYIQYSSNDERVNDILTRYLIKVILLENWIKKPLENTLTWRDLGPIGHTTTPENLKYISDWLYSEEN